MCIRDRYRGGIIRFKRTFTSIVYDWQLRRIFFWHWHHLLLTSTSFIIGLHFSSCFKKQPSTLETLTLANSTIGIKAKVKNLGHVMVKPYLLISILKSLDWLPVEERIVFKILLIKNKIWNGQSTSYLQPIIQEYHPSRTLR